MPLVAVIGSMSTGHDACAPVPAITGSPLMRVNGKAVVLVGDLFATHGCPAHSAHNGVVTQGSSLMRVEGKAIARIGDTIGGGGCPGSHKIATGDGLMNIE